ncbi:MAG: hypothetical protein H6733_10155 [Alphaproteobacteria bacterium]|nr:hypothetical protein [Alphaproteobacteria bacterium]
MYSFYDHIPRSGRLRDALMFLADAVDLAEEPAYLARFSAVECIVAHWVHHGGLKVMRQLADVDSPLFWGRGGKHARKRLPRPQWAQWEKGHSPNLKFSLWCAAFDLGVPIDDLVGEFPQHDYADDDNEGNFIDTRNTIMHGRTPFPQFHELFPISDAVENLAMRMFFGVTGIHLAPRSVIPAWFDEAPRTFATAPESIRWPLLDPPASEE